MRCRRSRGFSFMLRRLAAERELDPDPGSRAHRYHRGAGQHHRIERLHAHLHMDVGAGPLHACLCSAPHGEKLGVSPAPSFAGRPDAPADNGPPAFYFGLWWRRRRRRRTGDDRGRHRRCHRDRCHAHTGAHDRCCEHAGCWGKPQDRTWRDSRGGVRHGGTLDGFSTGHTFRGGGDAFFYALYIAGFHWASASPSVQETCPRKNSGLDVLLLSLQPIDRSVSSL